MNNYQLGEKRCEGASYEIERKFLIAYPDIGKLESIHCCQKVEIIQTYLKSEKNEEIRVRQREANGHCVYFKTIKKSVSGIKRIEIENQVSKDEYLSLLQDADASKRPICKTRYCLTYENQCFEIDVYPFWNDKAIMEIELRDENDVIKFPSDIKIIKEVTDDPSYKNSALAER